MIRIESKGHWDGDPRVYCGELCLATESVGDAKKLALLLRVLSERDQRDRLLEAAGAIESEALAARDPVLA